MQNNEGNKLNILLWKKSFFFSLFVLFELYMLIATSQQYRKYKHLASNMQSIRQLWRKFNAKDFL